MNQLCKVCGEPAAGFHFGAFTCEGCKSFFGRTYNNVSGVSECKNGGRCEINKKNRTSCKSCRLRKCLQVGMSKSGSRYGRRSNWFKIHCLLSAQSQQNGGMNSVPETNNNNSTVTNNNNANSNSSPNNHHHHHHLSHSKNLPSTITSHGGLGGGHGHSGPETDRDLRTHRERSSSSGTSHLLSHSTNNSSLPPPFPNLAAISPDTKEQFLSSFNRKLMTPELFEYFRSANVGLPPNGLGPKPFYPEERGEDMSRNSRSPGSLESPNSDASADDNNKSSHPLFGHPPGSPMDVKPNDILSFDLLTRDLMKLGYDPLRLWPAMLSTPSSLHQFNPYRFMFPMPGTGGAPPGFPTSPGSLLTNGFLGTGPILPNGSIIPSTKLHSTTSSVENLSPSPIPHQNRRFPLIVPPASSLTLTPPISHHGSDEPNNLSTSRIPRKFSTQDQPIDLSSKTVITNNNNNDIDSLVRVKSELLDQSDISDEDDHHLSPPPRNRRNHDTSSESSSHSRSSTPSRKEFKSELKDSGQDDDDEGHCDGDDESESFNYLQRNYDRKRRDRRSSSLTTTSNPLSKKMKLSTPLDLTRSTNSNPPPPTKIAT